MRIDQNAPCTPACFDRTTFYPLESTVLDSYRIPGDSCSARPSTPAILAPPALPPSDSVGNLLPPSAVTPCDSSVDDLLPPIRPRDPGPIRPRGVAPIRRLRRPLTPIRPRARSHPRHAALRQGRVPTALNQSPASRWLHSVDSPKKALDLSWVPIG
jgi:hypothetical protein